MRVGLIGDVHAEDAKLETVLAYFRDTADCVWCTGDIVDGTGDPSRCAELLSSNAAVVVRGNHDRWYMCGEARSLPYATKTGSLHSEAQLWLYKLPATVTMATPAGPVLLCHGIGDDDMATFEPKDHGYALEVNDVLRRVVGSGRWPIVVAGHTHRRMVREVGFTTWINVGTLRADHGPTFGILDTDALSMQFFDFGAENQILPSEEIGIRRRAAEPSNGAAA